MVSTVGPQVTQLDAVVESAVHLSERSKSTRLFLARSEARVPGLCGLSYACDLEP